MPTTTPSTSPVVRLSSPGEIVASLPVLCGFPPQESVVALSLRGRRLGLTVRLDLPAPEHQAAAADLVAARMLGDGASRVALVVLSEQGRRPELVEAFTERVGASGVEVLEALHVADGRWTSYRCTGPCCPAEGTAVVETSAVMLAAAESALLGKAVLRSRDELVASIAPPVLLAARAAERAYDAALERWADDRLRTNPVVARRLELRSARALLDAAREGRCPDLVAACTFAAPLEDVLVRDEIAGWALHRGDDVHALLQAVVPQLPVGGDAPACTLLGWVAYARGEGALAGIAFDRALASEPDYHLALLLMSLLEGGVDPAEVRRVMRPPSRRRSRRRRAC